MTELIAKLKQLDNVWGIDEDQNTVWLKYKDNRIKVSVENENNKPFYKVVHFKHLYVDYISEKPKNVHNINSFNLPIDIKYNRMIEFLETLNIYMNNLSQLKYGRKFYRYVGQNIVFVRYKEDKFEPSYKILPKFFVLSVKELAIDIYDYFKGLVNGIKTTLL